MKTGLCAVRNGMAAIARRCPGFRGKARIGVALCRLFEKLGKGGDLVTIDMRDGSRMRLDLRSRTEEWAFWTGEYEYAVINALSAFLPRDGVVLDVGANVGFYTASLGRKLQQGGGRLHAFEPVPSNYRRLCEVIALNRLEGTVKAHNVALGDREGRIQLCFEDSRAATTGNAVIMPDKSEKAERPVKESETHLDQLVREGRANASAIMTTLDRFSVTSNLDRCDLIKMDIEGAELMCLRGAGGVLSKFRPIIYGEFNAHWMQQFGHSFSDVWKIMRPLEYRVYRFTPERRWHEVVNRESVLEDVLLVPIEKATI